MRDLAAENLELVPQDEQLDVLRVQATATPNQGAKQSPEREIEKGEDHAVDPPSLQRETRHEYWRPSRLRQALVRRRDGRYRRHAEQELGVWDSQFVQNVTLLVVTAVLTSLLIPYILKRVEHKRTLEQKQREADLARQAKIIDAQAAFLDDISIHLWNWRYLSMKLAYYGAQHADVANPKYAEAEADYDKNLWDVFRLTRNEISRARRLLPSHMYQKLVALYEDEMVKLDNEIHQARGMHDISDRAEAFFTLNDRIYHRVTSNIDEVLNEIASELRLTQTLVTAERGDQTRDSGERRRLT